MKIVCTEIACEHNRLSLLPTARGVREAGSDETRLYSQASTESVTKNLKLHFNENCSSRVDRFPVFQFILDEATVSRLIFIPKVLNKNPP